MTSRGIYAPSVGTQTIARSAYRSYASRTRIQNLRIENATLHPEIRGFSDRARVSRTHAWQGDFLIQTKTVACSECITGYSSERDVAWQLIHVHVIHFREPFALIRTVWTLCCTIPPRVHLRSPGLPHPPRRCTARTIDATASDRPTTSRDDLILNQSTAVSRSIYNQPWYESLVTRRPTVRFNENILIDRDATGLPNSRRTSWKCD